METKFWAGRFDGNDHIELQAQTLIEAKKEAFRRIKDVPRIGLYVRGTHKGRCIAVRKGSKWRFNG